MCSHVQYADWLMAHCEIFNTGQKVSFLQNGQGQGAKQPSRKMKSIFGTILARDVRCCIFSIIVTLLSFWLMLERCCVHFLVHIPRICKGKSVDYLNLYFVHNIHTIKHFCYSNQLPPGRRSLTTCTWESLLRVLLQKLNFPLPCSYIHFMIYIHRCLFTIKLSQHKWD